MPKPTQNCLTCKNIQKCWASTTASGNPISANNVVINKLICSLQIGRDRDQATKNLLEIFKPGMINLISYAKQTGMANGMDVDQLLSDMQSMAIEYLIRDYKIGDRGRATPYLFDPQQGFLTKWIKWITSKNRKYQSRNELYSPIESTNEDTYSEADQMADTMSGDEGWGSLMEGGGQYNPYADEDEEAKEMLRIVNDIIEDGHTLNSNEYRVLKYCMHNANESNTSRNIDGLHIYLGNLIGVSRPRVTRLYSRARTKLINRYRQIISEEENA